jgi:hypothetical protein
MTTKQTKHIIRLLTDKGVHFDSGLTDDEVLQVETKFNIKFPPDLKLFLQISLPTSDSFVNWRLGLKSKSEADKIVLRLDWPLEGMLFDLQSNDFWVDSWGNRPDNYDDKVLIAKRHYETYPKLIPIYSHRYIPSLPNENDNPVFSVHQMDIIYYGYDLATYFANEFGFALTEYFELLDEPKKEIEFWSDWTG